MAATPHRRGKLPSSDEDGGPGAEEAAERALLHKGAASSPALGALSGGGRGGASPLDVASAGRGGSGAGRRRALHWVIYVLALCAGLGLLVYSADRSDRSHKSFVKVKGTQVSAPRPLALLDRPLTVAACSRLQFVLDCRPFFVTGFNLESAMLAPLPALARRLANGDKGCARSAAVWWARARRRCWSWCGGPPNALHCCRTPCRGVHMVRGVMEAAAGAGMNVMRAFAHSPDPNFPLQVWGRGWAGSTGSAAACCLIHAAA